MTAPEIRDQIRAKIIELAKELGRDARQLRDDEQIPTYLDSAGVMALIVWYEQQFNLDIDQEELTIENFGSVQAMVEYVCQHT